MNNNNNNIYQQMPLSQTDILYYRAESMQDSKLTFIQVEDKGVQNPSKRQITETPGTREGRIKGSINNHFEL